MSGSLESYQRHHEIKEPERGNKYQSANNKHNSFHGTIPMETMVLSHSRMKTVPKLLLFHVKTIDTIIEIMCVYYDEHYDFGEESNEV